MSATETDHADSISDPAERRLAVYGSLAPGRSNHHVLDGLAGRWTEGHVRGRLLAAGWGAELGYPGLILDSRAATVPVQVFESSALPAHWGRLDDFEGPGYERVVATVQTADGDLPACIYVLGGTEAEATLGGMSRSPPMGAAEPAVQGAARRESWDEVCGHTSRWS